MSNGVHQNPGELNKRVETLAASIIKQGSWFCKCEIVYQNKLQYKTYILLIYCMFGFFNTY